MGIGDWGLGIGDWGLGIGPNPQSPHSIYYYLLEKFKSINLQIKIILFYNIFN
jgi:hypothetical protein